MQTTFGGGGNALNTALGFGPSAIGFLDGKLYQNLSDLEAYMETIEADRVPVRAAEHMNAKTARRRAVMFGLQRLNVPRQLLGRREARMFAAWAKQDLLELRDDVYRLTVEGALWYNQMQLALLSVAEQRKLIGLLGTSRQQADALANHSTESTNPTQQLIALIREDGGIAGRLRLYGYKNLLRLKQMRVFDDRAVGFGGPLSSVRRTKLEREP